MDEQKTDEQKKKETAIGCGLLLVLAIGVLLGGVWLMDDGEPEAVDVGRPEEPARRAGADWDRWERNNPIAPTIDESFLCMDAIESLAEYDYQWNLLLRPGRPDGPPHFDRWRWFDAPRGESENPNGSEVRGDNRFLVMDGDVIEFQLGSGGWLRHTYMCTLDLSVDPPILYDVDAFPFGNLRTGTRVSQPRPPESPNRYVPPPRPSAPGPVRRPRQ